MLFLWAILFFIVAMILAFVAFGGVAIAISFFTKVLFFLAFICFLIGIVLIVVERIQTKENR